MCAADGRRDVSRLRGAQAQSVDRRFWRALGDFLIVIVAITIAVSFLSAAIDNARISRLKTRGVPVLVTVKDCVGNLGGSGSNAADYTCRGTYRVRHVRYLEVIGAKTTISPPGSTVRGVVDPDHLSSLELGTAVAVSSASASVYLVPSLMTLLWTALMVVVIRRRRSASTGSMENSSP